MNINRKPPPRGSSADVPSWLKCYPANVRLAMPSFEASPALSPVDGAVGGAPTFLHRTSARDVQNYCRCAHAWSSKERQRGRVGSE